MKKTVPRFVIAGFGIGMFLTASCVPSRTAWAQDQDKGALRLIMGDEDDFARIRASKKQDQILSAREKEQLKSVRNVQVAEYAAGKGVSVKELKAAAARSQPAPIVLGTGVASPKINQNQGCEKLALEIAIDRHAKVKNVPRGVAQQTVVAHFNAEQQKLQEHLKGRQPMTVGDFADHIFKCRGACKPYMAAFIQCAISRLSRSDRKAFVQFPVDEKQIPSQYRWPLRRLARFARQNDKHILIVGSSSRLPNEANTAWRYNLDLARSRAAGVRTFLTDRGVPEDRVSTVFLGWDPPRFSNPAIASEWGGEFETLWSSFTRDKVYLDQNAMVFVYTPIHHDS